MASRTNIKISRSIGKETGNRAKYNIRSPNRLTIEKWKWLTGRWRNAEMPVVLEAPSSSANVYGHKSKTKWETQWQTSFESTLPLSGARSNPHCSHSSLHITSIPGGVKDTCVWSLTSQTHVAVAVYRRYEVVKRNFHTPFLLAKKPKQWTWESGLWVMVKVAAYM